MEPHAPTREEMAALERQLVELRRRGKLTLALAVLGIAAAVVAMASRALPQRELRTSRLVLTDSLGRTRAALENAENGPALSLYGADEAVRARLGVSGQVGALSFLDSEGTQRLTLSGRPNLLFSDGSRGRLSLELGSDGPAVELIDGRGFATLHPVDGFKLYGSGGAPAASLEPGALSLYTTSQGPDAQLSVSLTAPRRPGERVRLLLYDQGDAPSFAAP